MKSRSRLEILIRSRSQSRRLRFRLVLPQASMQKSLDSQKNSLDLKKITRFKNFVLKFVILLEMI